MEPERTPCMISTDHHPPAFTARVLDDCAMTALDRLVRIASQKHFATGLIAKECTGTDATKRVTYTTRQATCPWHVHA